MAFDSSESCDASGQANDFLTPSDNRVICRKTELMVTLNPGSRSPWRRASGVRSPVG